MSENKRVDEILSSSVSMNRQLAQFGDKLCALTNQTFSKIDALNCINLITSLRTELIQMNTKIIESYVSEDKKEEYLETNMGFVTNIYQDNRQCADIIEQKANETILEESSNQEELPPIL